MISYYPPSKRTVLCIDDDQAILRYEKMLLERSGYAVLTAASAQQGLRLVTMCECDAVLIDYEMPVMNGHEIASQIRRIRPELTIILLSGSDVPTHVLPLFDAFVPKLEANRELLPLIAELCSRPPGPEPKQGFYPRRSALGQGPPLPPALKILLVTPSHSPLF